MKKKKTYEVVINGKTSYVSASSKKQVTNFFESSKPSTIIERNDISAEDNIDIDVEKKH